MKRPAGSAALARVLDGAAQLSRELGSVRAGTEHLLLALAQEQLSPAGRILDDQGAQCRLLRCMLLTEHAQRPPKAGRQWFSASARRAIVCAYREARRLSTCMSCPSSASRPTTGSVCGAHSTMLSQYSSNSFNSDCPPAAGAGFGMRRRSYVAENRQLRSTPRPVSRSVILRLMVLMAET